MAAGKTAYSCVKCQNSAYTTDEFRATGGNFAKLFDIQNKKFMTVSCTQCGYTEIYRGDTSKLGNIFDFFAGG
jgi:predicted nucleic-acid-binding Zn-ribbon protein